MIKLKKCTLVLLSIIFLFLYSSPKADAYPGGLLDGKTLFIARADFVGPTPVTQLTDGDLKTSRGFNAVASSTNLIYYDFSDPVDLTSLEINMTKFTGSRLDVYSTDKDGKEIRRIQVGNTGVYSFDSKNTKRIVISAPKSSTENYYIFEFDVFGTVQVPLERPMNLKAISGTRSLNVSFTPVKDALGYGVYLNGQKIKEEQQNTFNVTGLVPDQQYKLQVSALHKGGESALSDTVTATPYGDEIVSVLSGVAKWSQIELSWTGQSEDQAVTFSVYMLPNNATPILKDTKSTEYVHKGVVPEIEYSFFVRSKDKYGRLKDSNTFKITTPAKPKDTDPPDKPTGFTADMDEGMTSVHLNWNANKESDLDGYKLYVSADNKDFELLNKLIKNVKYIHAVKPSTTYKYKLIAVDDSGNDSEPEYVSIKTPSRNTEPEVKPGNDFLQVDWESVTGAVGYNIYLNGRLVGSATADEKSFKITKAMGYMPGAFVNKAEVRAQFADGSEGGSGSPESGGGGGTGGSEHLDFMDPLEMLKTSLGFLTIYIYWIVLALAVVFSPTLYNLLTRLVSYVNKKYSLKG